MSSGKKWLLTVIMAAVAVFSCMGCRLETVLPVSEPETANPEMAGPSKTAQTFPEMDPQQHYSSPEDVALYLHLFGRLPGNYITKAEASDLGWIANHGNLWDVAAGMSIGGDRFGNREQLLPEAPGRQYYECDVNYGGGFRGPERLVYSNDGLIFYTADHYQSYELVYGEWLE